MEFQAKFFSCKEQLPGRRFKELLCCVVIGLLLMSLFSGKSNIELRTIAVSPNERYIACSGNGDGYKIYCFHTDGSLAFDYDVPLDISSGGNCTLWFENDVLCVLFYRTDKIVSFAMDGAIINIADDTADETPPKYPSFAIKEHKYVFEGKNIDVIYDTGGFLGYWIFCAERYLAITPKNGETIVIMSWSAQNP